MDHQRRAARSAEMAADRGQQAALAQQPGDQGQRPLRQQDLLEHRIVIEQPGDVLHALEVVGLGGRRIDSATGLALDAGEDRGFGPRDLILRKYARHDGVAQAFQFDQVALKAERGDGVEHAPQRLVAGAGQRRLGRHRPPPCLRRSGGRRREPSSPFPVLIRART
jgi:hypothetical protein